MNPIPDDIKRTLNPAQLMTLHIAQDDGWKLLFIRRDGQNVPIPVIKSADTKTIGVIDENGNLNSSPDITIRMNP